MNKHVLNGITSAMMSLGLWGGTAQAYATSSAPTSYLRSGGTASSGTATDHDLFNHNSDSNRQSERLALTTADLMMSPSASEDLVLNRVQQPSVSPQNNRTQSLDLTLKSMQATTGLILVDGAVPDKHTFYQSIKPGYEVVFIDESKDGLSQLKSVLSQYKDLNSLHVVSHATDGVLQIGTSQIDEALLKQEINTLAALDRALKDNADVMFYGCDLAKSEKGESLIQLISEEAKVDVAASNDLTGSAALSADWDLEIINGDIESEIPFNKLALINFSSVLTSYLPADFCNQNGGYCNSLATETSADGKFTLTGDGEVIRRRNSGGNVIYSYTTALDDDGYMVVSSTAALGNFNLTALTVHMFENFVCDISITNNRGEAIGTINDAVGSINGIVVPITANATNISSFKVATVGCSNENALGLESFSAVPYTVPEINVKGNGQSIVDEDISPTTDDHTDFGTHRASEANLTRTFTIESTGTGALDLTGSPIVAISGSTDFTITGQPTVDPVPAGSSTTFQVTLDPTTVGTQTATISIANNDADENPYNFAIKANVQALDADGSLTAGAGVTEPVAIDSTIDSVGEAVNVFDFTLSDGGTADGLAMNISQIVVNVAGTSSDADRASLTWRLSGNDASNVIGSYNAAEDKITFSGLSISVADGGSETYTVNAFYNDNTNLTDKLTYELSVDGDTDVTISSGTRMGATTPVTNGSGATFQVNATRLAFATQPAGSVSGSALVTQPVVVAQDAFGNTDKDFAETITLTEASAGLLTNASAVATAGRATFTGLTYSATADQESFTLSANDQDAIGSNIAPVNANAVVSDVVATKLVFDQQPSPLTLRHGSYISLDQPPLVSARDANNIVDTGYATDIKLEGANGSVQPLLTSDADTSLFQLYYVTHTPVSGVASFAGLNIDYVIQEQSNKASDTFNLRASSGSFTAIDSSLITVIALDSNASVTAAATVSEPVPLYLSANSVGTSWDVFDFTLKDGSGATPTDNDGKSFKVSAIAIDVSGTSSDAERAAITWRLSGPDVSSVPGTYDASSDQIRFSGLNISVDNTSSETYTLNAYFNDVSSVTHGNTVALSISDASNLTVDATGTQLTFGSAITNGTGAVITDDVDPTIVSVTVPASKTHILGENLDFSVTFSEVVSFQEGSGDPKLTLDINGVTKEAIYLSGRNSKTLNFRYVVEANLEDKDGISVASAIDFGSNPITDLVGNTLQVNVANFATQNVNVDTKKPVVSEVVAVPALDNDSTPNITLSTSEDGVLSLGNGCGTSSPVTLSAGNVTLTLTSNDNVTGLFAGTWTCNATVTDEAGNVSDTLQLSAFSVDLLAPQLTMVTPVTTPTNDVSPNVTLSTTEVGTLALTGSCGTSSAKNITTAGSVVLNLTQPDGVSDLADGTYSNCAVTMTDAAGNQSAALSIAEFTVDTQIPTISETTAVTTPGNNNKPSVTINSSESGTVSVGGSCGTSTTAISVGDNVVTLTKPDNSSALADGAYENCTVSVTDSGGNTSTALSLTDFVVDTTAPALTAAPSARAISEGDTAVVINGTHLSATDAVSEADKVYYLLDTIPASGTLKKNGVALAKDDSFTQKDLADGLVTYDHNGDENTADAFKFAMVDGLSNKDDNGGNFFNYSFTIAAVNDAPTTVADAASTDEDNAVTINVLANDSDVDNTINATTVVVVSDVTNGETSVDATTGAVTYTPSENFNGEDSFTYTVQDASGATSNVATVTVTVDSINDKPVAVADSASTTQNNAISIDVAANDTDVDSGDAVDASTIAITTNASNGNAVVESGKLVYTPNSNYAGADTVSYTIQDGNGATSEIAVVSITVSDVSAPFVSISTGVSAIGNNAQPSLGFTSTEAGTLTVAGSCGSANTAVAAGPNTITLSTPVTFTNLADGLYTGCTIVVTDAANNASFPVTIDTFLIDTQKPSVTEAVAVVTPGNNNKPSVTINSSESGTVSMGGSCGTSTTTISVGDNVVTLTKPDNSSALADGAYENCTVSVTDSGGNTSTVLSLTDFVVDTTAPALTAAPSVRAISEGDTAVAINGTHLSATDAVSEADKVYYLLDTIPANGILKKNGVALAKDDSFTQKDLTDGLIAYDHNGDENTADAFKFALVDGLSNQDDNGGNFFSYSFTIAAVNDAPTTIADAASTDEDNAVTINVLTNDSDVDDTINVATVAIVSGAGNGTTSVDTGNGQITYTPSANFNGQDSFTYTVQDASGATSNVATVTITVDAVNDAPVAVDDTASTFVDTAKAIDVLANDTDVDTGDTLSVNSIATTENGTALIQDGKILFTPAAGSIATGKVTYNVTDNNSGTSELATVTIEIVPNSSALAISGTPASEMEVDRTYAFTPTISGADDAFPVTFSIVNKPSWASFNSATGALTGTASVSNTSGIVISATDGTTTVALPAFDLAVVAKLDSDGDTISDYQEKLDGTDPNDSSDYVDTTAPVIDTPDSITVDATGLYTAISLIDLLKLDDDADEAAIQAALKARVTDNVDGDGCCDFGVNDDTNGTYRFAPGTHNVLWKAEDKKGNISTSTQIVNVRPAVTFGQDGVTAEGNTFKAEVFLNGEAHEYPYTLPFVITDESTVDATDHTLVAGNVTFAEGETKAVISIETKADSIADDGEMLYIALDEDTADFNKGDKTQFGLRIVETNLAPSVQLAVTQGEIATQKVLRDGGNVTIEATVTDQNPADTHIFEWVSEISDIQDTDGDESNNTFVFDPSNLPVGAYPLSLVTTDSGNSSHTANVNVIVVASLPTLGDDDADNDGVIDSQEGHGDSDGDGIPDYLDNLAQKNVLPEEASVTDKFLMETSSGLAFKLGQFALQGNSGGSMLTAVDVETIDNLLPDSESLTEAFDFEINQIAQAGSTVAVIIPLRKAAPEDAVFRLFNGNNWNDFNESANDAVYSAAGSEGFCPGLGSDDWTVGIEEGHYCVLLKVQDGGVNDSDDQANQAVTMTGGVSVLGEASDGRSRDRGKSWRERIGSVQPMMLLALGLLFVLRRRTQ